MREARLRPDSYTVVALARSAFFAQRGLPAVRQLLSEMEGHGVPLGVECGTALLCCLRHIPPGEEAAALEAAGQLFGRLRALCPQQCNAATYNSLMLVHLAAADWAGVLRVFEELEGSEVLPNSITWDLLLAACRKAGWRDKLAQFEALQKTWEVLGMPNSARRKLSALGDA